MSKTPTTNGSRDAIKCPGCGRLFVNRSHKACGSCGIGIKYKGDLIYKGDWYWDEVVGWKTYDQLLEMTDE